MKESNAIHFEKDAFNLASTVATLLNKVLVTLIRQVVFFLMTDCPAMIVGESFILRSGCKPYSDVPLCGDTVVIDISRPLFVGVSRPLLGPIGRLITFLFLPCGGHSRWSG